MTQPNSAMSAGRFATVTAYAVAGVVSLALIGCVTLLLLNDKGVGELISLIGTGILPILSLVVMGKLTGLQQTTEKVHAVSEVVQKNTNGTQTQMLDMIAELQRELAKRPAPPSSDQ